MSDTSEEALLRELDTFLIGDEYEPAAPLPVAQTPQLAKARPVKKF